MVVVVVVENGKAKTVKIDCPG